MPLPILFVGTAVLTTVAGTAKTAQAAHENKQAKKLNDNSDKRVEYAISRLENHRKQCALSLENLGKEKLFILDNNMKRFLNTFSKIKNVDFRNTVDPDEFKNRHIDKAEFKDLEKMTDFAEDLAKGAVAGAAGGALAAAGAYSAAGTFAIASTGTAIGSLSGAAATNATLAFFGGGSIAAGGMGMTAGAAVLGGLVAGPALLIMGEIVGAKAGTNLEKARENSEKASQYCEDYEKGADKCIAIRRRCDIFYALLARLDARFLSQICRVEEIFENEGDDYSLYSAESKKTLATAASTAVTIKAVLDTPILSKDGSLAPESEKYIDTEE